MADNSSSTSVAAVAIVLLVLVGLFGFYMVWRGDAADQPDLQVEVDDPFRRGE